MSSRSPIPANHTHAKRVIYTYSLSNLPHRSIETTTENRIIMPPIVGVPCFSRCFFGPSSLTTWPIFIFLNVSITKLPIIRVIIKAVIAAKAERTVIYLKMLRAENWALNGYIK
ncbi:MAG: hypothetical protein BWY84_00950 [Candidatus Aerophobetes bacterium ADurb.Bin490]|nr:MAG: hypothetical protein BWY84_00950 [Candidatus Aerophobetes bacterium ADurb.Bin490]